MTGALDHREPRVWHSLLPAPSLFRSRQLVLASDDDQGWAIGGVKHLTRVDSCSHPPLGGGKPLGAILQPNATYPTDNIRPGVSSGQGHQHLAHFTPDRFVPFP